MTWTLQIRQRTNADDEMSAPNYMPHTRTPARTRKDARALLADFVAANGLRVLSACPSRHGVLLDTDQVARFSYGIAQVSVDGGAR